MDGGRKVVRGLQERGVVLADPTERVRVEHLHEKLGTRQKGLRNLIREFSKQVIF